MNSLNYLYNQHITFVSERLPEVNIYIKKKTIINYYTVKSLW